VNHDQHQLTVHCSVQVLESGVKIMLRLASGFVVYDEVVTKNKLIFFHNHSNIQAAITATAPLQVGRNKKSENC